MDLSNTGRSALRQAQGVLRQAQDDSPPLHDAVLLLLISGSNPWSVPSPTTFSGIMHLFCRPYGAERRWGEYFYWPRPLRGWRHGVMLILKQNGPRRGHSYVAYRFADETDPVGVAGIFMD